MQFTNKNTGKGILDALGTVQGQLESTILFWPTAASTVYNNSPYVVKKEVILYISAFHRHLLAHRKCN